MGIVRTREIYEHWGDIGAEPAGVNYEVTDIEGMFGLWARPRGAPRDRVLLCTHGGGYRVGSPYSHRKLYAHLAKQAQAQALVVDYRRVPEAIFPAAVLDTTRAYRHLLRKGISPTNIAIAGDSAGGCLAVCTALSIRSEGMPLPAAVLSMSPAIDPYAMGASYESNKDKDFLLSRSLMRNVGKGYLANEADARHPLATPLNSDLHGMPPLYVQVGGDEVLLDDSLRLADLARSARVEAQLDVYAHMQHVFQMGAGFVPEADAALVQAGTWLDRQWR
jgi:acetyl esterase/lipase